MSKVASCMSSQFSRETRFPECILYGGWAGINGSVVCFSHKKQVESKVSTCVSLFLPLTYGGFLSKSWPHRAAGKPCSCSPHSLSVAAIRHWSFVHSLSLASCRRPALGTQCGFCYLSSVNQACAARPIKRGWEDTVIFKLFLTFVNLLRQNFTLQPRSRKQLSSH